MTPRRDGRTVRITGGATYIFETHARAIVFVFAAERVVAGYVPGDVRAEATERAGAEAAPLSVVAAELGGRAA